MVTRAAFVGFDFFHTCLRIILEAGVQVGKVFSFETGPNDSNKFIKAMAKRNGLPFILDRIRRSDIEGLVTEGCDHLFVAGYPHRIPTDERIKMINIHPTLLPEGRGPSPLPHVILKQLGRSGVTFHRISEVFDHGDIICQEKFRVNERETLESLCCKCQMAAERLLPRYLSDPSRLWDDATPQEEGSYWASFSAEEQELNWTRPSAEIERTVRAFGKPGSKARVAGRNWLVKDVTVWAEDHAHTPGTLAHRTHRELVVACSDGFVCLRFYRLIR